MAPSARGRSARALVLATLLGSAAAAWRDLMQFEGLRIPAPEAWEATGRAADVRRLFARLFPLVDYAHAQPVLPECAAGWKVFVYDLPPRFHATLQERLERARGPANCGWLRGACLERSQSKSYGEFSYSNLRQYAAELPLLAKLLRMEQTDDPLKADLIVVPWLMATEVAAAAKAFSFGGGGAYLRRCACRRAHSLLGQLRRSGLIRTGAATASAGTTRRSSCFRTSAAR